MFAAPALVAQKGPAPDPAITAALKSVSAERLRADVEKMVSFGTRHTLSSDAKPGRGIKAAREWVKSEFERIGKECGGCLDVKEDRFVAEKAARIPQASEIVNIYAVMRGNDPAQSARTLLIGGHLDSRASDVMQPETDSPGANDDASGVAATIEAARVLSRTKLPATVVFIAFSGEEQGLNGSRHMAELAKKEGWQIEAFLNNDTIGGDKSTGQNVNTVRVFSEGIPAAALDQAKTIRGLGAENDSTSRQIARYLADVAAGYTPGLKVTMIWRPDRYLRGGDHTPYNEAGFPAVRLVEWRENYDRQHQDVRAESGRQFGDLPQFVDYNYLAQVTKLNVGALASLALAPAPPRNVKLLTKELTNDSTLTWTAAPGAGAYEVVWRDTSASQWQEARRFENVTTATVPVSKDNVVFGVRSVGPKGHRSLVVTPVPER